MASASANGNEVSELIQAQIHLSKHAVHFVSSMSLKCAIDLGIPDAIHNHGKPMTLHELAPALHIHPAKTSHLRRLLRLLAHSGFLATTNKEEEEEAYLLTPPSKLLVRGNEPCLSPAVLLLLIPALCDSFHSWKNWFYGEEVTPFESHNGVSLWDFLGQNQEVSNAFNEAMAANSQMMRLIFREWKPVFEGLGTMVDVGGGTGTMAKIISESFPNLKCIVLDLPHVVSGLPDSRNLSYIGGDIFKSSIPPANAALLKNVLHDWDDEHCIKILKNCKEAVGKEGKVIIIEMVIDEKNDDHGLTEWKLHMDIVMTLANGKERNGKEWEKLFIESGFSSYKIISTLASKSIIEVYP